MTEKQKQDLFYINDLCDKVTIGQLTVREALQTALNDKGEASKKVYDEFYPNDCIGEKIRNASPVMKEVGDE